MHMLNLFRNTAFGAAMDAVPLLAMDVGARGGVESDLLPVAFATDTIGFEPDADAFQALQSTEQGCWRSAVYVPKAVADGPGPRTLNLTRDPVSTTLLTPDPEIGARFDKPQFFEVVGTKTVECIGLDAAVAAYAPRSPDYLKIDIEGAERQVMGASGAATLQAALALKVEVAAFRMRQEQAVFSELDALLRSSGFELMDITDASHWRRHGHEIAPRLANETIPFSRGQWVQADALYMRPPNLVAEDGTASLRAAWLAMTYGFFDAAEAYLSAEPARTALSGLLDGRIDQALREASGVFGRAERRRAMIGAGRTFLSLLKNTVLRRG